MPLYRAAANTLVNLVAADGASGGFVKDSEVSTFARTFLDEADGRTVARVLSVPFILAQSGAAVSHTGNTNEVALATIAVPAGALGANGSVVIETVWSYTNNANNKTLRVRFGGVGGTQYLTNAVTTTLAVRDSRIITNRNATNSQVGGYSVGILAGGWGGNGNAAITSSVDTTASADIVISGQLATGTDTVTLESYQVTLFTKV